MPCSWNGQNVKALSEDELYAVADGAIKEPDAQSPVRMGMSAVSKSIRDYVNERDAARVIDETLGTNPDKVQFKDIFQNINGSRSRAQYFLSHGTTTDPFNFSKGSDANVEEAYRMAKKAGGTKDGMVRYQVALQQLQDHARGLDVAMPEPVAMEVVRLGHSKYAAATKYLNREVFDKVLEYEKNAGVYSDAQVQAMIRDNPYYIKQARDVADAPGGGSGRGVKARQSAKKEGSKRAIVQPMQATVEAIGARIANADKNMALRALVGLDSRITTSMGIVKLGDIADLKTSGPATRRQFDVLENGKRTRYEIAEGPLADGLTAMIHGAAPVEVGLMGKVANFFASVKRSGVTSMADFLARGLFRDSVTASILNKHGGLPFQRMIEGVYHTMFKGTGVMDEYFRSGGFGAALNEMDINYFERRIDKTFGETNGWHAVINTFRTPLEAWQAVATRVDSLNRIGQFAALRRKGQDPMKAAMGSRDYTLDFATRGASGVLQRFAAATPFLRPTILGNAQMVSAFVKRPISTTTKAALYITAPTLLLSVLNEMADEHLDEKDRYAAIPRWQRDLFWITPPIGGADGPRIRLPKPFVLGQVFGSLPERALEAFKHKDPNAYKGWKENFLATLALPMIPAIAEPVGEDWTKTDSMNWRPLIPASLESNSGYMQYSPNTSATAVELARFLGPPGVNIADVSPIVLENYVTSWAGSAGNAVLSLVDKAYEPPNDVKELTDNPFIKGLLVRQNDMGTPVIEDFYDNVKRINAARADLKLAVQRQDETEIDFTKGNPAAMLKISRLQTAMGKHQTAIRGIRYDKTMTVDEKRQEIEKLYIAMRTMAKAGNEAINAAEH